MTDPGGDAQNPAGADPSGPGPWQTPPAPNQLSSPGLANGEAAQPQAGYDPWAQSQTPYQPSYQAPYGYPVAAQSSGRWMTLLAVAIAAVVAVGGGFAAMTLSSAGSATPAPRDSFAPDSGAVVYSIDFTTGHSGWKETTYDDGTSYEGTTAGYVITGRDDYNYFSYAPYGGDRRQLSVSMTASQVGSGEEMGFGVVCYDESEDLSYEFIVYSGGDWTIMRREGSLEEQRSPTKYASGSDVTPAGAKPMTVVGICSSVDARTIRIVMFVDGRLVSDTTDTTDTLETWLGGIVVSSEKTGPTVTVTGYQQRDLER